MKGIIYKATNIINNKFYIGKTVKTIERRKYEHYTFGKKLSYFQKAIKKYGKDNFVWEILKECDTYEDLTASEIQFIKELDATKNGYNLTCGGDGAAYGDLNVSKRPEVRLKLKLSFLGRTHTIETINKIKETQTGRKAPEERVIRSAATLIKNGTLIGRFVGEKSVLAKKFYITHPDGLEQEITGLKNFCREHMLDAKSMRRVARGEQDNHKGYKCKYVNE